MKVPAVGWDPTLTPAQDNPARTRTRFDPNTTTVTKSAGALQVTSFRPTSAMAAGIQPPTPRKATPGDIWQPEGCGPGSQVQQNAIDLRSRQQRSCGAHIEIELPLMGLCTSAGLQLHHRVLAIGFSNETVDRAADDR